MKNIKTIVFLMLFTILQKASFAQQWTLEGCLQYAEEHNMEVLANEEGVKASRSQKQATRSVLLPEINGRAELDHYWRIPVQAFPAELIGGEPRTFVPVRISTPWTANFGLDASLPLADPSLWQKAKLSSLQLQMAESEMRSLKQVLFKNVRMAYYNVQAEHDNYEASQQLEESYREIHRLISLQYEKGLIDRIAYNQSLSMLRDRQEASTQSGVALRSAYLDLKFWMGFPLQDSLIIANEVEVSLLLSKAFQPHHHPEWELRNLRKTEAEQQWKISRAGLLPSLSAVSAFQRIAFRNSFDFLGNGDWFNVGSVGLRLNIPILSLKQMVYEPSQQKALWKKASYEFEQYLAEQERTFLKENMQLAQAYALWQNQKENLNRAKENEALTIRKIENGIIDMLQLRQVQDDLSQVQQKLSKARLEYFTHYVELEYLQSPSQE